MRPTSTVEESVAAANSIRLRGARVHNLRGVDVDLPRDKLVVITGVSGSGKSSLAFDTLFAEGERRYLESLSASTRRYLDQMERPDLDSLEGLPPTLSIEQRVGTAHPRSTLATTTEIYDFLRVLYARAGTPHCDRCGRPVSQQSAQAIVERILSLETGRRVMIMAPLVRGRKGAHREVFEKICRDGYVRARVDGEIIDAAEPPDLKKSKPHEIEVVIDRLTVKEGIRPRLFESVELALKQGEGSCIVSHQAGANWEDCLFSSRFACATCEVSFPDIEPRSFSFNSPYGACTACNGLGYRPVEKGGQAPQNIDFSAIAALPGASPLFSTGCDVAESNRETNAAGETICPSCRGARLCPLARAVTVGDLGIHQFTALTVTAAEQEVRRWQEGLWGGRREQKFDDSGRGVIDPPQSPLRKGGSEQQATLPEGGREKHATLRTGGIESLFDVTGRRVAEKILPEIVSRLQFLEKVGLDYVTLDRPTNTLSGGEFQRARLAGCLGTGLVGVCYILDEPTAGLHPRDTGRLLAALLELKDQGNSVIVVEHDVDVMESADHLVDLGPGAGREGGCIVAQGTIREVQCDPHSVTGRFLRGGTATAFAVAPSRRIVDSARVLTIAGASTRNLQNLTVDIPLGVLTCVTGVSGSGKSSLIMETLVPQVRAALLQRGGFAGRDFTEGSDPTTTPKRRDAASTTLAALRGVTQVDRLVEIDQSPIGRSGRSNPATASGMWDEVRRVFARTKEARLRGFRSSRFSFNAPGGRCEECRGWGTRRIAMHFLPDLNVVCPACQGTRFNRQTLQVRFRGKNVAEVLNLRIDEAAVFFENFAALRVKLDTFAEVGLGYLLLGQSAQTLSGGEAQRVKLATELGRKDTGRALFVLDEPTTGLHPADIERLLKLLQKLVDQGHTVLVIEHQLDVIGSADWVIDLGPEGGAGGGSVVAMGTPEQVARVAESHTGQALVRYRSASDTQGEVMGKYEI